MNAHWELDILKQKCGLKEKYMIASTSIYYSLKDSLGTSLVVQWLRICLQCERPCSIPGLGRSPGEGKRLPIPVFWPEEFHGLYSSWGHKELNMAERLSLSH